MSEGMTDALLSLRNVTRVYRSGESEIRALDDLSLEIRAGEFIAIMGQSGSGKSTLMHILGCLDRPSSGVYRVAGRDVADMDADQLAALRRNIFGFVFQRYNLLPTETAAENVEIPAIYAGLTQTQRRRRALELLSGLGLGDRTSHRPSELSGGQQQRVSIARALMNNARVILADEPTGALDSRSGMEVLELLTELHRQGTTVILITHDAHVAAYAKRVIRLRDGRVVEDTATVDSRPVDAPLQDESRGLASFESIREAVHMALRSLRANLFRTALTLLGVIIGVAAVVSMLAIGEGSKKDILDRIQSMGTNLLVIRPGGEGYRAPEITTLTSDDAKAIETLPGIAAAVPERQTRATLRYGNRDYGTQVQGTSENFASARDWSLARGVFLGPDDLSSYAPVIVLGKTVVDNLFPGQDPLGKYVLVKNTPFQVIGVLWPKGASSWGTDMDDIAMIPLSTGFLHVFGKRYLSSITVKVAQPEQVDAAETAIRELLTARHLQEDFQIRNTASLLEAVSDTQNTLTLLLGSVAAISLLVGGIGVMNIMLVSVTERTREIGIRMATGARARDILLQFNIESMVVCCIGGLLGVALGSGTAYAVRLLDLKSVLTPFPALLAFTCALVTGLVFGYLPARKAANLDPVAALASE
jgi:macrolide transport system ATP-binding/permease protein